MRLVEGEMDQVHSGRQAGGMCEPHDYVREVYRGGFYEEE